MVDGVSFEIHAGEIVGLLGPNGAGKTTALSMLSTIIRPDSGRVVVHRDASDDGRAPLGLVPQSLALYPTLTVAENVWHFAGMMGLRRDAARAARIRVLEDVGLGDRAGDPMQSLSGGMKRRLNLACGIVHRLGVLLLDEPTVGVDLESREQSSTWCIASATTAPASSTARTHGRGRADLRPRGAHRRWPPGRFGERRTSGPARGKPVSHAGHLPRHGAHRPPPRARRCARILACGVRRAAVARARDPALVGDVLAEISRSGAKVLDCSRASTKIRASAQARVVEAPLAAISGATLALPGALDVVERPAIDGAPTAVNAFDQYAPGSASRSC